MDSSYDILILAAIVIQVQEGIRPRMFKSLIGAGHPEFASARQQVLVLDKYRRNEGWGCLTYGMRRYGPGFVVVKIVHRFDFLNSLLHSLLRLSVYVNGIEFLPIFLEFVMRCKP